MQGQYKILTVIVTYNRLELLKRCIKAAQRQSYTGHDILVINNSSPDGTEEYLKTEGVGFLTQSNGGSSAGWHTGISKAIEGDYDLVWMMDDDGFPAVNALETLLQHLDPTVAALSSLVVKENAPEEFVFGLPKLNKNGFPILFSTQRKYNKRSELIKDTISYPHFHPFNGTLLKVSNCKMIGNIDKSYFMYGDESDYLYKIKRLGKTLTILDALHYHPDVSQRVLEKKKVYYYIRNTIILNHLYLDHSVLRDLFTVGTALYMVTKRNGIKESLGYFLGKNRKYFYPAIVDGYKKRKISLYQNE